MATKCVKCHNVLTSGGVTFRGEPWHKVSQTTTSQQSEIFLVSPRSVLSAPAVRPPWPGRSSPAERRNLSVLSVLQSSSPRDVPAAPNPSLARGEPGEPGRGEERREIFSVVRFISFEGRHWHSACFICALCKQSMAGKGFITDGEDIICPECAKDKLMGPN